MADFIYDQMITAQDLNSIAIDLGVADFNVFENNKPYAVDKLNEITSALVGSGILSTLNKFELSVSEEKIVVGTGIAIFETGKKFKLTEPITLDFMSGELYLYENSSTGVVSLNIGTLPTDNYIHLATTNSDSSYTDRRIFAKAKVMLPTEASTYSFTHEIQCSTYSSSINNTTFTMPIDGVSEIYIAASNSSNAMFIYDVNTQLFRGFEPMRDGDYMYVKGKTEITLDYAETNSVIRFNLCVETQNASNVTFKYTTDCPEYESLSGTLNIKYAAFGGVEK